MRQAEEIVTRQINRWNSIAEVLHRDTGLEPQHVAQEMSDIHPVICVSRDLGAGARKIVGDLAEELNYEVFGKALVDQIATNLKVQRQLVESLDETVRTNLERVFEGFLRGRGIGAEEYLRSLARVVEALALKGGVILLGRGAAYILGRRSALNVLITADVESRVRRLTTYEEIDEKEAHRRITESDRQRQAFVKKYFKRRAGDLHDFDLVLNTTRVPPARGAHVILQALDSRGLDVESMRILLPERGKGEGKA